MGDVDDYEPGDNRQFLKHPTTYLETLVHFLKACIGTGILAMPYAFKEVGWISGLVGTIVVGGLCVYMTNRLAITSRRMCIKQRKPIMSYVETADATLQYGPQCVRNFKYFGTLANFFLILYQFGCSCIYVVFVAGNLKHLWDYAYPDLNYDVRLFMVVMMLPQFIVATVDNYKYLAYFTLVADISTVIAFTLMFACYLLVDMKPLSEISTFSNGVMRFPMFVSTVFFSMEAIAIVLALENEMKNPKYYTGIFGVVNLGMVPSVILYTIFGFFGYLKFGSEVKTSITFNLSVEHTAGKIIVIALCFAIFFTYHLSVFVTYDLLYKSYILRPEEAERSALSNVMRHYLVRLFIIVGTNICSMGIPDLSLFISFLGALTLSVTGFGFIVLMWIFINWDRYSGLPFTCFISYNCLLLFLAVCVLVLGLGQAIYDIVQFYIDEE